MTDLIFAGNYDGRGHWITELFCDHVVSGHAGLFGYVQGGLLRNIMLREATIHGLGLSPGVGTGGLVGRINGGEIHGCHAHGVIRDTGSSGTTYNLGGLVGYCVDSQIHRSSSAGTVSGSRVSYASGLVGTLRHSTIMDCHASAAVHGRFYIGGLLGANYAGNPLVLPASATGTTTEWIFPPPAVDPGNPMMIRISITPQE